jgi:transmembrane sensor
LVTSPEERAPTANVVIVRPESRTLADGSVVDLNAGAEIDVDFTGAWRRVTLRKGEAHFRVAKDAQRPFVVAVGTVEVRAVGTAFSVELGQQAIEVLVTEGVVVLNRPAHDSTLQSSATPTAAAPTFIAGKMIVVPLALPGNAAPAQQVTTLSKTDIEQHLAWRVPRLEFAGTPLAQALPMFNQHGRVQLSLADPALGQLQLSGVLRADDTETLLRLLEGEFGLIAESSGGEILIRRRP